MQAKTPSPLAPVLRQYRGTLVAVTVFSVFINLLQLTLPLYLMNVFTHVFNSLSGDTLALLTLAALGALALQALVEGLRSKVLSRLGATFDAQVGRQALDALLRVSAGSSSRSSQVMRDVNDLRMFLSGPNVYRAVDILFTPLFVAIIYLLHPLLGLIALGGAILLMVLAVANELATRPPLNAQSTESLKSFGRLDDYVRNADVIEAMGMRPAVLNRWDRDNRRKLTHVVVAGDRAGWFGTLAHFVRMMLQIVLIAAGAYLYLQHELGPGSMIAASLLMGRGLAPLDSGIATWKSVVAGREAYRRLSDLLRLAGARSESMSLPAPRGHLSVEKLTVLAPGGGEARLLLKNVAFELPAGEMLGIIGPSGAGKTTLGRALVGVMPAAGGTVRLDGADVFRWNGDELGRYVGYLPQDVQLFGGTVAENIGRLSETPSTEAVIQAARLAGVHEMILRLPKGYDTPVGEGGQALSAGQRQHVGLARAFLGQPRLVVLDEPNSNLDAAAEVALVQAMAAARSAGTTLVVITHRPSILEGADKLLVLKEGSVEAFGPREEVMARFRQRAATAMGGRTPVAAMPSYPQVQAIPGRGSVTALRADKSSA